MPIDTEATWINSPGAGQVEYTAAELRLADATLAAGDGTGFLVRGGISPHATSSLAVAVDGSDQVTIQPGAVLIPGATAGAGCYRTGLAAAHTEALTARNATNPRIDLVIYRALDPDAVGTHAARTGRVEVLPGAPAGSPAVPALPSLAVELARITVPASGGGAATVDSSWRTFACAAGGELLVTTAARLPAAAPPWQRARTLDTGKTYVWTGAAWDPRDTGWQNIPLAGGFEASGGDTPQYRVVDGNKVYLRGTVARGSGNFIAATTYQIGTIPAVGRPANEVVVVTNIGTTTNTSRLSVGPGGAINVRPAVDAGSIGLDLNYLND